MSTTVDSRVVEMRFDNKHFENNVQTSMNSIEKLNQKLNLTGATKGLEDIDNAVKKVNMSGISSAVESVQAKFSAFQVMAVTALANITNSAINAGKRIASALTIDPIKTGFSEYETKINAIQTIMSNTASKGTTMKDVTRVIGELNTYADKTIYNFAEMTRNIGTFTAAGVGLEESAAAIQGIANLAASSGSTSQQASTAMYQLSQALASGTVKLMDWNSVVNAGMGGEKFQEALKATAREHGVAVDDIIKKNGSFRESLSDGWLSADILNETLKKFTVDGAKEYAKSMVESGKYTQEQADALIKEAQAMEDAATKVKTFTQLWDTLKESAQSGWSQTWEIIVGDFEEAKETLTKFSEVIGGMLEASANARNELLQGWKDAGGRADLIESLYNVFEGVINIVKPIKEAFREIFPPLTVQQLVNFTKNLKDLTAKFKLSETTSNNLKRTFKGLFALLDIGKQLFTSVVKAVSSLFGTVGDLGGGILGVTAKIGDFLVKLRDGVKASEIFDKVLQRLVTAIKFVFNGFKNVCSFIGDVFTGAFSGITTSMESMGSAFENWSLFKILQSVWNGIKTITSGIISVIGSLASGVADKLGGGGLVGILEILNELITGGIGVLIGKLIYSFSNAVDGFGDIADNIADIFGGVGDVLQGFQAKLKAEALMKIAIAIGILSASLLVISLIDSEKLYDSIVAIAALFGMLMGTLTLVQKSAGPIKGTASMTATLLGMSVSVLILASALKKIATLDFDELTRGLVGVAGLMAIVITTVKMLGQGGQTAIKGATQIVILASAIKILASACEDLSGLSWGELAKGLVGVGILITQVSSFINNTTSSGKAISTGIGIVLLTSAIKILASACKDFSRMDWGEIAKSLVSVGVLIAGFTVFTNKIGNTKGLVSAGISLIAIAASMKIFASALHDMAGLTWEELAKGLLGMAGALWATVAALANMPTNMVSKGVGLIAIATALLIMSEAMNKLGGMSWESIAKGLVSLGASMIILAAGLKAMNGTISGSAAMMIATVALAMLTPVLLILGSMSWQSIAKGLITLAGAFAIMGVAGHLLQPVVPAIIGLAGAMTLIGVGVFALGAGLLAAGAGLSALAVGFTAVAGSLAAIVTVVVELVASFIVGVIKGVGEGIIALCEVISSGVPAIGKAIKAVILTLCDVLVECAPVIVNTIGELLVSLLESLSKYIPQIVDALFKFVINVLDSLAKNIPKFIVKILDIIGSLFTGVVEALKSADPNVIIKAILSVGLLAGVMAALAAVASLTPAAMVGVLGMGAVIAELAIVLAAIGVLAQLPGLNWLIEEGGELLQNIGNAIGGFIGGIVGGIAEGFTSALPDIATDLSDFMTNLEPFIEGAKRVDSSTMDGVKSIVGVVLALTAANVIEGLTSWITGGSSLTKFGEEIAAFGPNLRAYADSVAGIDTNAIKASSEAAKALADMTSIIPNEGGVVAWFAGENSIAKFGSELPILGQGLKGFSDSVAGIYPENIIAASNAAKTLADMTSTIPNEGGMVAWFTGENSVAHFASEIVTLGEGLKGFSDAISGIIPANIVAAAEAAKVLADMTSTIPNDGGIVAWFSGDNSVARFGDEIIALGHGLKGFSDAIVGVVPENVAAAANAAKALAEMANVIPNEGGMVAWFTGENSIANFSDELPLLGYALKGFSDAVIGIVPENVTAAANAAKTLAEMTATLPNEGGMASWFTGERSMSKFSADIVMLGTGLKGFSDKVTGITPEHVTAAANAAKTLAEMTSYLPNEGGMTSWFTGEKSVSKFSNDLVNLGEGLRGFSDRTAGINPENVTAAVNAAKSLAEMANTIPNEGGIVAWFTGEKSLAKFGDKLPALGEGLKGFSDSVAGIVPENVTAAANAAKSLAEMTGTVPNETDKIVSFGDNIAAFGKSLGSYFSKTASISGESITASTNAINAVKNVSTIDSGAVKSAAKAIKELIESLKGMNKITASTASGFKKAISELGKTGVKALIEAFDNAESKFKKAGQNAVNAIIDGVESRENSAKKAFKNLVEDCADAISDKSSSFKSAGRQCVAGFVQGIDANIFKAEAKARAMAKAALKAAEKALGIHSPSKEFYKDGVFAGQGFVNALADYESISYKSGYAMASSAKTGLIEAISRIGDIINNDMDTQPTIRPVLDLSDIRSGARTIGGILGFGSSVGILANVGAVSSMMNRRNQNGNSDVVSAINKLRGDLDKVGNTSYNINGVTYDDNSSLAEAVKTIIDVAKVERRK